jgi:DnaK suppressor protein
MEPLTQAETDQLIATLTTLKAELAEVLRQTVEDAKPVDLDLPIGRLSRMDAMQQQQMSRAGRALYQKRLTMVEAALDNHKNGEYGYCRDCGEPVGVARLTARPETPFCITCQEAMEKRST